MRKLMIIVAVAALLLSTAALVLSDDHEQKRHGKKTHEDEDGRGKNGKRGWAGGEDSVPPVSSQLYQDNCGACHFAYQPALLPAQSWLALLDGVNDHFGESLDLPPEDLDALSDYLAANAAEVSESEIGQKIVDCLQGATPLRITDVPAFQHKHRKISADVLKRESVGGVQNCPACHTNADQGDYEHPRIPK